MALIVGLHFVTFAADSTQARFDDGISYIDYIKSDIFGYQSTGIEAIICLRRLFGIFENNLDQSELFES